jgi:hypothetical protein
MGRLQALPEPVLKRVVTDEPGIGGCENVLMAAIPCTLPGEFHRVDEDESCGCSSADLVVRDQIRREAGDI